MKLVFLFFSYPQKINLFSQEINWEGTVPQLVQDQAMGITTQISRFGYRQEDNSLWCPSAILFSRHQELFNGVKRHDTSVRATTCADLLPRLKMSGSLPPSP